MFGGWLTAIINLMLGGDGDEPVGRTICGLTARRREYTLDAGPRVQSLKAEPRSYSLSAEGCECC